MLFMMHLVQSALPAETNNTDISLAYDNNHFFSIWGLLIRDHSAELCYGLFIHVLSWKATESQEGTELCWSMSDFFPVMVYVTSAHMSLATASPIAKPKLKRRKTFYNEEKCYSHSGYMKAGQGQGENS